MSWGDRIIGPVPDLPAPGAFSDERRAGIVLWSVAVLLVLLIFRMGFPNPGDLHAGWSHIRAASLGGRLYWASWGGLFYFLVPLAIIVFVFRESPARYGLRLYLSKRTAIIYLLLILGMIPLLYWASGQTSFLKKYPFVHDLGPEWSTILLWEVVYVARFVCLEFFFRGYMLFGLEGKLGMHAIAATAVPYGIMHFAKPFPEAFGAVIAGAILGYLALRTRSIIGGVVIHSTIAVGMDLLALWRKGVIF